jgi:transcription elongation factor GreA
MAQTHHLSQSAFDRLNAELFDLTGRGRIEVANKIERAREMGDLRENGDYHAAKDEQGHMEARIRHIEAILENCEIVETDDDGTVKPGCLVTFLYEGDDEDDSETYLLASIEERHSEYETMSPQSALGQALLGAQAGDTVSYETPTGAVLSVEVVSVELP